MPGSKWRNTNPGKAYVIEGIKLLFGALQDLYRHVAKIAHVQGGSAVANRARRRRAHTDRAPAQCWATHQACVRLEKRIPLGGGGKRKRHRQRHLLSHLDGLRFEKKKKQLHFHGFHGSLTELRQLLYGPELRQLLYGLP